MAKVPYQPYPTEAPTEAGPSGFRVDTPSAAFGGATAHALEGLGKDITHAGDELFKRAEALQQLKNETDAKNADAQYMIEAGKLHAEFSAKEGVNADAAYPKYQQDLNATRMAIRQGLPTDQARKFYDASSLGVMGRSIFNGAGHAAAQRKKAYDDSNKAVITSNLQSIEQFPKDEVGYQAAVSKIDAATQALAASQGWTPERTNEEMANNRSTALAHSLLGQSHTDPLSAINRFEANRDKLRDKDAEVLEARLYGKGIVTASRNIVDGEMQEGKSLRDIQAAAKKKAEEFAAGWDESHRNQLVDAVERNVNAKYNQTKAADIQFRNENINTIYGALNGAYTQGQVPQTFDALLHSDPKVEQAYYALDESHKARIRNAHSTAIRQGAKVDDTLSLQTRDRFLGMAINEPDKFMEADLYAKDLQINPGDRRALTNLRNQMMKGPAGNTQVPWALGILKRDRGADMAALGIFNRTKESAELYDTFTGQLSTALEVWAEEHQGRRPTPEELKDKIWPQLSKQTESAFPWGWFGYGAPGGPAFNVPVPDAEAERIKADYLKANNVSPTDAAVQRIYAREQLKKVKPKPSTGPSAPESK